MVGICLVDIPVPWNIIILYHHKGASKEKQTRHGMKWRGGFLGGDEMKWEVVLFTLRQCFFLSSQPPVMLDCAHILCDSLCC